MTYRYVTDQNIVAPETWHFLPSTSSLVSITHILYELLLQSAQIFHALQWSHNGRNGVSNHQPHDCLLKRLFRHTWNKYQSSSSLAFVRGIHRWPANSPPKGPVTRKMLPFYDVIMGTMYYCDYYKYHIGEHAWWVYNVQYLHNKHHSHDRGWFKTFYVKPILLE